MKRLRYFLMLWLPLLLLEACDVHEWPEQPERVPFILKLSYEKDMTVWEHLHDECHRAGIRRNIRQWP